MTSDKAANERALAEAVAAKHYTDAARTLLGMAVYLPTVGEQAMLLTCGRGDRQLVRAYTSEAAATTAAERIRPDEPPFGALEHRFPELLRTWTSDELGVVINPDTEAELQIPRDLFARVLGLRWRDIPVGEDDARPYFRSLSPRLADWIGQVGWCPVENFVIRYVFVPRLSAETTTLRLPAEEHAALAQNLARAVREELGPKPANLQPDVELEAARFVGVRVTATVEAEADADIGWLQSRSARALNTFLHPQTGGPDGDGWPIGRTLTADQVRGVLTDLNGVRSVREIRLARTTPFTEQIFDPVDEIVLDPDCTLCLIDHDVTVVPAAPSDQPVRTSRKTRQAVGIGIAVTPVVLATVLQLVDAASAPLWVVVALITLTGVATVVATTRAAKVADAAAPSNTPAPGRLTIADVKVSHVRDGVLALDFRVSNSGGSTVSIHTVELESVAVDVEWVAGGVQEISATYDVDITRLQSVGAYVSCDVAQQIAPGDVDRFKLSLHGRFSASFTRFAIRPILVTNFGPVSGELIELFGRNAAR